MFAGAFAFGIGFDTGVTAFYDHWNKGVRQF
jgi:ubiquinol-cytochrome c reductase subunit 9